MTEIWLPVPTKIGLYAISDHGNVFSEKGGIILKPQPNSKGYLRFWLGRGKPVFVHHLVLEVFEGPRPDGLWALHKDDDHSNNRWSNLYYGTPTENAQDLLRNGKHHQRNKTECLNGHEFTPENTLPNGPRGRGCRECARRRSRDYMRNRYQPNKISTAIKHEGSAA